MDFKCDNYQTLITVPATDCNFTAALGYASKDELLKAHYYLEDNPAGNKSRLKAVKSEIKRREQEAKS